MNAPIATEGPLCPLHKKDVSKVCHKCAWYVPVRGKHPQSEEILDAWKCAIAWGPMLLVNVAQETHQGAAATESFRNEVVTRAQRAMIASRGDLS